MHCEGVLRNMSVFSHSPRDGLELLGTGEMSLLGYYIKCFFIDDLLSQFGIYRLPCVNAFLFWTSIRMLSFLTGWPILRIRTTECIYIFAHFFVGSELAALSCLSVLFLLFT